MFTGNEDLQITLTEGSQLTANYRASQAAGGVTDPVLGHYISRKAMETILAQPNCVGMRTYYAEAANGEKKIVFAGVTADGNDITTGFIGDRDFKSPPFKGANNSLNT